MSDSLGPHELQHTRLPCPPLSPEVYLNPCALSRWCHPTSVGQFSSCPQCFPESESFSNELLLHIRWPKYWSFSFSISPTNQIIYTHTHFCKTANLIWQQMGSGKSFYMKIFSEICPLNFKTGKRIHFLPMFYSEVFSITYLI